MTDLAEVRRRMLEGQQKGDPLPTRKNKQVLVDRQGHVKLGDKTRRSEARELSQVPRTTFAWFGRRSEEKNIVRNKMPSNTTPMTIDGYEGWHYGFINEYGQFFSMFGYYAGRGEYKVRLTLPEVEVRYRDVQKTHLYPDAHICLSSQVGQLVRSLEQAYAKSVIWSNGWRIQLCRIPNHFRT